MQSFNQLRESDIEMGPTMSGELRKSIISRTTIPMMEDIHQCRDDFGGDDRPEFIYKRAYTLANERSDFMLIYLVWQVR